MWETTLVILGGVVWCCWWKQCGARAERWGAAQRLLKPSYLQCLHIATQSPPAAALRVHQVFIFQGCRTSKKWSVIRPAAYHKRAGRIWKFSCSCIGRCATARPSSTALQHGHSEGHLGGSKTNPGQKEGHVWWWLQPGGQSLLPWLAAYERSAHKKLLSEISPELHQVVEGKQFSCYMTQTHT